MAAGRDKTLRHPWTRAADAPGRGAFEADLALTDAALLAEFPDELDPHVDPLILDALRERRQRRRAEEVARDRLDHQDRREKQTNDDTAAISDLMQLWLDSEEYRRLSQDILGQISDAKHAARLAYERALEEEQQAREELEGVRDNAIVLSDGRRVYFTQDAAELYGEDHRQITDQPTIDEAGRLHGQRPDASTYEAYVERWQRDRAAANRVERLSDALEQLDELEEQVRTGELSREELEQVQQETKRIVADLPPEARKDYEHIRARRDEPEAGYRAADGLYEDEAFSSAPAASEHFQDATARPADADGAPDEQPGATPAPQQTVDPRPSF